MELKGKVNKYVCKDCQYLFFTINLNTGTTPFGIQCILCKGHDSCSQFYNIGRVNGTIQIDYCFYRPKELPADKDEVKHIYQGGLLFGEIGKVDALINDEINLSSTAEDLKTYLDKVYKR